MPMLPVRTPEKQYHTLNDIRLRKEELAKQIQHDSERFSTLWKGLFVSRKTSSKGEFVTSLVSNGITAVDTFLLVRKLMKNYGRFFGRKH